MAEGKDTVNFKNIKNIAMNIQTNMNKLYTNTFLSTPTNRDNLEDIKTKIDKSLDSIFNKNENTTGTPTIAKLYSRMLMNTQKDSNVIKDIEGVFDDKLLMEGILSTYMENKYLKDLDSEIDVVCKYMPKLLEALEVKKDNVLSADHFSKDFITILNDSSNSKPTIFNERIKEIKTIYNLAEIIETSYSNASKYGEDFLYIVPYDRAISKLLGNKDTTQLSRINASEGRILTESGEIINMTTEDKPSFLNESSDGDLDLKKSLDFKIELSRSNMIDSVIRAKESSFNKIKSIQEHSLNYSHLHFIKEDTKTNPTLEKRVKLDSGITNGLDFSNFGQDEDRFSSNDGLIANKTKTDVDKRTTIDIPGCVIKRIERQNIIPIYIEDLCLGYYYLEFKENDEFDSISRLSDPLMSMKGNKSGMDKNDQNKKDQLLRYISGQLSSFIDKSFINSNQDLRKEIYMILKYNDVFNTPSAEKIKVTFLPPEDVTHIYFRKDPKTNRGISDLERSLLPAKLYSSLYITNVIGVMTRGQDKRVYYVKQNVDTNISKVLLNTINQIKKSNFNIRQIENINHILNITGAFNDYIIPKGPNGDAPVDFEIMPGQNIEIKTELMNILEEMAINNTDVPLELIQARQSMDYAVHYTMTNSKFLRKVYTRQGQYQRFCSNIVTKVYNYEYKETEQLILNLPPPMFLNITNTNQVISNANQLVEEIVSMEMPQEENPDQALVGLFKKELKRNYLGSYVDLEMVERAKSKALMELQKKPVKEEE